MKNMAGLFGLVGILVVVGIIAAFWGAGGHPADVINQAKPAMEQAHQMAGEDSEGMKAKDSIRLSPEVRDGKLKYVLVDSLVAGGPMEKYFGLKQDDAIIAAGPLDFKDQDSAMAVALILEAYQRKQELKVMRNGQKITLPLDASVAPTSAAPPVTGHTTPLSRQLDAISGAQKRGE